jgi:hypothetical protein
MVLIRMKPETEEAVEKILRQGKLQKETPAVPIDVVFEMLAGAVPALPRAS